MNAQQFTRNSGIVAPCLGPQRGREQEIFAWLPANAKMLRAASLDRLQRDYEGNLEIINEDQRIVFQLRIAACSQSEIASATKTLRTLINKHLGYLIPIN